MYNHGTLSVKALLYDWLGALCQKCPKCEGRGYLEVVSSRCPQCCGEGYTLTTLGHQLRFLVRSVRG